MHHSGIRGYIMKLFYRLLYNEFAWTYDLVAWLVSFGQWKSWGRTIIPHIGTRSRRILELASGPGHLLVSMSQQGLKPIGIDTSPAMCRLATRALHRAGVSVPIVRARAQALPFQDNSFDCSVATFPTEFIFNPVTLREVARVICQTSEQVPDNSWQMGIVGWVRFGQHTIPSRLLDWLYCVTGQGEPSVDIGDDILKQGGFESQVVASRVGHNDVMLVLARQKE
ncbi:MAG: class I SAM-dependent methyltransferase [Anaerolineae bacterium]|nr:class I SAM-dependent methyltransferase [Anaerolineae bacterium]